MKFTLTPAGGRPVVLGDDGAGDYITTDLPEQTRAAQVRSAVRAAYVEPLDRVTRSNEASWFVERVHADEDAAAIFKWTHAQDVPNLGLLQITRDDNFSLWVEEALITEVRCVLHNGRTTKFQYRFIGGEILSRNPNL